MISIKYKRNPFKTLGAVVFCRKVYELTKQINKQEDCPRTVQQLATAQFGITKLTTTQTKFQDDLLNNVGRDAF